MPFRACRFQYVKGTGGALLAGAAHGKFHDDDGKREDQKKGDVEQHEGRAAVEAGDVGKPPYVAKTDGTGGSDEDKSQTGGKMFSLHGELLSRRTAQMICLPYYIAGGRPVQLSRRPGDAALFYNSFFTE